MTQLIPHSYNSGHGKQCAPPTFPSTVSNAAVQALSVDGWGGRAAERSRTTALHVRQGQDACHFSCRHPACARCRPSVSDSCSLLQTGGGSERSQPAPLNGEIPALRLGVTLRIFGYRADAVVPSVDNVFAHGSSYTRRPIDSQSLFPAWAVQVPMRRRVGLRNLMDWDMASDANGIFGRAHPYVRHSIIQRGDVLTDTRFRPSCFAL